MSAPFTHAIPDPAWLIIVRQEAQRAQLRTCQLLGHRRQAPVVVARHIAWKRIRDELGWSFPKIARVVGVRNHTTIGYAVAKLNDERTKYGVGRLKARRVNE